MLRKEIPGYEKQYAAQEDGSIVSLARISYQNHYLPERILRPTTTSRGYYVVTLCKNGLLKYYSLHRLIALTFLGVSNLEVNHKDGDKLNNAVCNLEYVTRLENHKHAINTGLAKAWKGELNPKAKLDEIKVDSIRTLYGSGKYTQTTLASMFGVDQTSISSIVTKKSWR